MKSIAKTFVAALDYNHGGDLVQIKAEGPDKIQLINNILKKTHFLLLFIDIT